MKGLKKMSWKKLKTKRGSGKNWTIWVFLSFAPIM
jgi:hypothetical protein